MASETEAANLALVLLGQPRILSLDDDRVSARTLKSAWAIERRAVIRDGSWNFATTRAELAATAGVTPAPYSFAYQVPNDFLRLLGVLDSWGDESGDYQLEGRTILANGAAPQLIRYLRDVSNMGEWDAEAVNAFAHRIAWTCGEKLCGSAFSSTDMERRYRLALAASKGVDAMENPPIDQAESSWIEARAGVASGWRRPGWEIW